MAADAAPLPNSPGPFPVEIPQSSIAQSSSLWDRISKWASDNKGTVYAIAGVTLVVTAAGTMYYLSDSNKVTAPPPTKRKSKRDRKKAKEKADTKDAPKAESSTTSTEPKKASVAAAAEDELPEVDESSINGLTEEVYSATASPQSRANE